MTVLETPTGDITLRSNQVQLASSVERTVRVTPAGVRITVGDGGWAPDLVTITQRVSDPVYPAAVKRVEALIAQLRSATRLRMLSQVADVVAVHSVRRRNQGLHWDVSVDLTVGLWTTLQVVYTVTVLGQTVTISSDPLTLEVT